MFEPWNKYKEDMEEIPVEGPPCLNCQHWKPRRRYIQENGPLYGLFDGVVLCHAKDQERDFSCFKERTHG